MVYIYALLSIAFGAVAQLFLKLGVSGILDGGVTLRALFRLSSNLQFWIGIVCYGVSLLLWLYVLTNLELSRAYPMVSIGYIFAMVLAYFFLSEPITLMKALGILFIIVGVILISRP